MNVYPSEPICAVALLGVLIAVSGLVLLRGWRAGYLPLRPRDLLLALAALALILLYGGVLP